MSGLFYTCEKCGKDKIASEFLPARSLFFPQNKTPICIECLEDMIDENDGSLDFVDKLCRWLDIPFIPDRWIEYSTANGSAALSTYVNTTLTENYPMIDWREMNEEYKGLLAQGNLRNAFSILKDADMEKLREKWGEEYLDKEIAYLEDLYQGILQTQNINSKLQADDAKQLCKIKLLIENRIRGGEDFDKLIKSYDTIRKSAGLTEKNIKNANDFDSFGEVFAYCEKLGWLNDFYDDTPRDQVVTVMKDVQTWIRNLYKNETGIGEDVDRRIEALKAADAMEESILAIPDEEELDDFDAEGYDDDFDEEAGV